MIRRSYRITMKAAGEMELDGLTEDDMVESILNAITVRSKRSTSEDRRFQREKIRILEGFTYDGILVYTKGVIRHEAGRDVLYILVSAKRSTLGGRE